MKNKILIFLKKGIVLFVILLGVDRLRVDFFSLGSNPLTYFDCVALVLIATIIDFFSKREIGGKNN
jgi:hypothetical protein